MWIADRTRTIPDSGRAIPPSCHVEHGADENLPAMLWMIARATTAISSERREAR